MHYNFYVRVMLDDGRGGSEGGGGEGRLVIT